jgi:hypothetical protein
VTQSISTTLVNSLATTIANTFNDGALDLYNGTVGATPEDVSGGTLLTSIKLPVVAFSVPLGGAISLAGQWFSTVTTTGTATWGRFRDNATTTFMTVSVTNTSGSGDIKLATTSLVMDGVVEVTSFAWTVPST